MKLSRDKVERALLTFAQAFVAALLITDEPLTAAAAVGALGAALSVTYHYIRGLRN